MISWYLFILSPTHYSNTLSLLLTLLSFFPVFFLYRVYRAFLALRVPSTLQWRWRWVGWECPSILNSDMILHCRCLWVGAKLEFMMIELELIGPYLPGLAILPILQNWFHVILQK